MMKKLNLLVAVLFIAAAASRSLGADPSDKEKSAASDKVRAAVQAICPVSGEKLGAHGTPVKVKIGQEEMFLCCKACAKGKVDPKHWATIHANFAKAQRICPVMKHELPAKAKWTIVEGRIVYVCCPPCIEKVKAQPKAYLAEVDKLYAKSLKQR